MKKLATFGIAVALTSAALAGQAAAKSEEIIVDGTITSGSFDGAAVKGDSYQEIFYVDVADLTITSSSASDYGSPGPITGVTIKVGGQTDSFTPAYSSVSYSTSGGTSVWDMQAFGGGDSTAFDIASTSTFGDPFISTVMLKVNGSPVYNDGSSYNDISLKNTNLGLNPTSVFPEPSIWTLMIGGVALAGMMLRRKPQTSDLVATVVG